MEYTNNTYETAVRNPECEPHLYNPGSQIHNAPSWFAQLINREGYETICKMCNVKPHTDEEIKQSAYELKYAEYSDGDWQSKSREIRVLFKLDRERLSGIETENIPQPKPRIEKQCSHCGCLTSELMTSAHGNVCPNCYDECSN